MNSLEKKMFAILSEGREQFGVLATKAEFEAEGTRTDELLRLLDIANKANVGLALKIGGCEAIRDLLEAKQFGVRFIIAPMVETPYALSKYIQAKEKIFSKEEQADVSFLFNVETQTSVQNLSQILSLASQHPGCDGVVFGRVDYSCSLGLGRRGIDSDLVTNTIALVSRQCKHHGLDFVVGGGISIDAVSTLRHFYSTHLSRFETRKIVFSSEALSLPDLSYALRQAVHFELLWLLNKREYYGMLHKEDEARIMLLESRWKILNP